MLLKNIGIEKSDGKGKSSLLINKEKILGGGFEFSICWVIALPSEARPIISAYKLTKTDDEAVFPIYKNEVTGQLLIISGIRFKSRKSFICEVEKFSIGLKRPSPALLIRMLASG